MVLFLLHTIYYKKRSEKFNNFCEYNIAHNILHQLYSVVLYLYVHSVNNYSSLHIADICTNQIGEIKLF